jgi:hypothetical protein
MTPVKSSMVTHQNYSADTKTLRVRFAGGQEYDYHGVSEGDHARLMSADSFGAHFGKNIRASKRSTKVGEK